MRDPAVDAYLADIGEVPRASLEALRATILDIVPEAIECLSCGVPGDRVHGETIAGFAAATRHLSSFPHSGSILAEMADELDGWSWSKGTLRFDVGAELPRTLVERLITARLAQVDRA